MCFTVPLQVKKLIKNTAVMEDGRTVKLGLLESRVMVNDWLLVKLDLAVEKLTKSEALEVRNAIKEATHGQI